MNSIYYHILCLCLFPVTLYANPLVSFTAPEVSAKENGGAIQLLVTANQASASALTIQYSVAGSATAGSDYQALSGSAQISANALATTITLTPVNDAIQEKDETIIIALTSVSGGTGVGVPARISITLKDDDLPLVNFSSSGATTVEGSKTINATVGLSKTNTLPVTAYYRLKGTASMGADYDALSGEVTFAAGQVSQTIAINLLEDAEEEPNEAVVLELYGTLGANLGSTLQYTLTVQDNELPSAYFVQSELKIDERQQDITPQVELSRAATQTVTVTYELGGWAENGKDYRHTVAALTFPAGTTRRPIPITILDDTEFEGDEAIELRLKSATNASVSASRATESIVIVDNEVPSVSFPFTTASVLESSGGNYITVALSAAGTKQVDIEYTVEGTATAGSDYQPLTGKLSFAPGELSKTINLTLINDSTYENAEELTIKLVNSGANANLGLNTEYKLSILDDDQPPPLKLSPNGVAASVPDIAIDALGNAHVIWKGNNNLWYARLDAQGKIVVPARQLTSSGGILVPRVAVDKLDRVHVVYATASRATIGYIRISSATVEMTKGIQIFPSTIYSTQTYDYPAIAIDPNNRPVVAAEGRISNNGTPAAGKDFIAAVAIGADGKIDLGTRWAGYDHPFGSGVAQFNGATRCDITVDAAGQYHLTWKHKETSWAGPQVAYRGQTQTQAQYFGNYDVLNTYGGPQISLGDAGYVEVGWINTGKMMYWQKLTTLGAKAGAAQVVSDLEAKPRWPELVGGFGRVFFAWMDDRSSQTQIRARNSDDTPFSRNLSDSPAGASFQRIAARSNQSVDYVWSDNRGGQQCIYYRQWNTGATIQSRQEYDRASEELLLDARVYDPQVGEIKAGDVTWSFKDGSGSELAKGKLYFSDGSGMWTTRQKFNPALNPGFYRVELKANYLRGTQMMNGDGRAQVVVYPYFSIIGKVTEKKTGNALKNVAMTVSASRNSDAALWTAYTNDKGEYELKNLVGSKAHYLRANLEHYTRWSQKIELPSEGQQLVINMELQDGVDRPVINGGSLKYAGIFFAGLASLNNEYTVNVEWKEGTSGYVDYSANDTYKGRATADAEGNVKFTVPIQLWFTGMTGSQSNFLKLVAVDSLGRKSEQYAQPIYVIPLPDPFMQIFYSANLLFGGVFGSDPVLQGEYTFKEWTVLKSIPLIGKFGPDLKVTFGGLFKLISGEWNVYVNGRPEGRWAKEGMDVNLTKSRKDQRILLNLGQAEIEVTPQLQLSGKATATEGITFNDPELSIKAAFKDRLFEFLATDFMPGGTVARLLDYLKRWSMDLNSIQRGSVWADFALGAKTVVSLRPSIRPQNLDVSFEPGLRLLYNPKLAEDLYAELTTGGKGSLTVNLLPDCTGLKAGSLTLYGALIIKAKTYEKNFEYDLLNWEWSNAGLVPRRLALAKSAVEDSGWAPISRPNLAFGAARFALGDDTRKREPATQAALEQFLAMTPNRNKAGQPKSAVPLQSQVTIVSNVFPETENVLAARGNELMMLYVDDNGGANPYQFTNIYWTRFNGSTWSPATAILNDAQAEFTPTLAYDGNGDVIALWERVKSNGFNGNDLALMAPQLEIVWSRWDHSANTWSTPAALTNNAFLDHAPLVTGPMSDGSVLAVWTENQANLFVGNSASGTTSNSTVRTAKWSSATKTWGTVTALRSNLTGRYSQALAGAGSSALYAYIADKNLAANGQSDTEVYYHLWNGSAWGSAIQLTSDTTTNTTIRATVAANGTKTLLWRAGADLVMNRNLASSTTLVRAGSAGYGFTDFGLAQSAAGNLGLVWQEQSPLGCDAYYSIYDPATGHWGDDLQLTDDKNLEYRFAPAWDGANNFTLAYNSQVIGVSTKTVTLEGGGTLKIPNVPTRGQTDLRVLKQQPTRDLVLNPGSFTFTATTGLPGDLITFTAKAANQGALPVVNPVLALYDGNPAAGGTEIMRRTLANVFDGGSTVTATLEWTVPQPATAHTIYAVLDPDKAVAEYHEYNNQQTISFGGTDLQPQGLTNQVVRADGSARVVVKLHNLGGPTAPVTILGLRPTGGTGAALCTASVPAIAAGAEMEVPLDLPTASVPAGTVKKFMVRADDTTVTQDVNTANNTVEISLAGSKEVTPPPSVAVGIMTDQTTVYAAEGGTGNLSVWLNAMPAADVTLAVTRTAGDSNLSVSGGATLTFTRANYATAQTVTFSAAEDADTANGTATMRIAQSGGTAIASKNVTARELDNDSQNSVGGTLAGTTTWSDTTKDYVLTSKLIVPVGVTLTIGSNVTVRGTSADTGIEVQGRLVTNAGAKFLLYTNGIYYVSGRRHGITVKSGGTAQMTRGLLRTVEVGSNANDVFGWWSAGLLGEDGATLTLKGMNFECVPPAGANRTPYGVAWYANTIVTLSTDTGVTPAVPCGFNNFGAGIGWTLGGAAQSVALSQFSRCDYNVMLMGNVTGQYVLNNKGNTIHYNINNFFDGALGSGGFLTIKSGGRVTCAAGSELRSVGDQWLTVESGGLLSCTQALSDMVSPIRVQGTLTATSTTFVSQQAKIYYDSGRRNGIEVKAGGQATLTGCSAYYREGGQSVMDTGWWSAMLLVLGPDTAAALPAGKLTLVNSFLTNTHGPGNFMTPYATLLQSNINWSITGNTFVDNYRSVYADTLPTSGVLTANDFVNSADYAACNIATNWLRARANYWGSPTGPTHSGNPGGLGDRVTDYVDYSQIVTAPQHKLFQVLTPTTGQILNQLTSAADQNNVALIGFRINPGLCPLDRIGFALKDKTGAMAWEKIGNFRVALDANGDGAITGSETTTVAGTAVTFVDGASLGIRFETPFTAAGSSAANYILLADLRTLAAGDGFTAMLDDRNFIAKTAVPIQIRTNPVQHLIDGKVMLADHAKDQVGDGLNSLPNQTDVVLHRFNLQGAGKQIEKITFNIGSIQGITALKLQNTRLVADANLNGLADANEVAVGGVPTIAISGASGTIVFNTVFSAPGARVLVSDLVGLAGGDRMTVSLGAADVDVVGVETATGACQAATHIVDYSLLLNKSLNWTAPINFGNPSSPLQQPLLGFALWPTGQQINKLTIHIKNALGITQGEIGGAKLYWDLDSDGQLEASDPLLAVASSVLLAGGQGTINFTTPFESRGDLILAADLTGLESGDELTLALSSVDIEGLPEQIVTGSIPDVRHAVGGGLASQFNKNMKWTLTYRSPGGTAVSGRFNHKGDRVILGYDTGSAWIYDVNGNTPLIMLKDHYDKVRYAGFSSDDQKAVTVSRDGAVYIWDISTSGTLSSAMFSDLLVTYAVPSPDFSKLMAITEGKGVLLNIDTQQKLWEFIPGSATVNAIAYSPDGKTVAIGASDKRAYILDVKTGVRQGTPFIGHSQAVTAVGFTSDSAKLMTASSDGMVQLWNIAAHSVISSISLGGNAQGAAVSPDGSRVCIIAGSGDSAELQMYQPVQGNMLQLYARNINTTSGGNWGGTLENLTFDDVTGKVLINSSGKGWGASAAFRVSDGSFIRQWGPQGNFSDRYAWDSRPRISRDGERLFYLSDWGMNLLLRTPGKTIRRSQTLTSAYGFDISQDGARLGWMDGQYNGALHMETVSEGGFAPLYALAKSFYYYSAITMSPDGTQCSVGNQLFNTQTGQKFAQYGASANGNRGAFSPDGARWGYQDPSNKALITCRTNDPYATLDRMALTDPDTPFMMQYHPDNQRIGCAYRWTWDKHYSGVQMYDMDSNDGVGLYKHDGELYDSAISEDGSLILLGGDNNVRLYDMKTGSILRYFYPMHSSLADVKVRTVQFAKHDSLIMIAWNYNYIETYERSRTVQVALNPATRTLRKNQSQAFQVELVYDDGTRRNITPVANAADNAVNLEIEPAGRATVSGNMVTVAADAFGQFKVIARYREGSQNFTGESIVTIGDALLVDLSADPVKMSINPGVSRPITYTARYADGFQTDVTSQVVLTADRPEDVEITGQSVKVQPSAAPGNIIITGAYTDAAGTKRTAQTTIAVFGPRTSWERYRVTGGGYGLSGAYSPDGKQLALGSSSGAINLYEVGATPTQYRLTHVFLGHAAPIRELAYMSATKIVTAAEDGTIRTWAVDSPSTKPLTTYTHAGTLSAAKLFNEGATSYLAFGDTQGRVGLLNLTTNVRLWLGTPHTAEVTSLALDGTRVISGARDKRIRVYTRATGAVTNTLNIHSQAVIALGFLNSGMLYTIGEDNTMNRLSSTYELLERYDFPAKPSAAAVLGGNLYVAMTDPVSTWVYNMDGLLLRWLDNPPAEGRIVHLLLDPPGTYLLTGRITGKKTVSQKFMGVEIGSEEVISPFASYQFWEGGRGIFRGSLAHSFPLTAAHATAAGKVFTQDAKRTMVWTLGAGAMTSASRLMETGYFITPRFAGMDFNGDSSILATRVDQSIFMYDTVKNLLWKTMHTEPGAFAISPLNTRMATGAGFTKLWDLTNLSLIRQDPRACVSLDFKGETYFVGAIPGDQFVGIWNAGGLMGMGVTTQHSPTRVFLNRAGTRLLVISEEVTGGGLDEQVHNYYLETYNVQNSFENNQEPTLISTVFLLSITSDPFASSGAEQVGFCTAVSEDATLALVGSSGNRPVKLLNMNDGATIREFYPPVGKVEANIGAAAVEFLPGDNAALIGWAEGYGELWRRVAASSLGLRVLAADGPTTGTPKSAWKELGTDKALTTIKVKPGQVLQLEATANYSNGDKLNVTASSTYASDKPAAITFTGSVATVKPNAESQVITITGTYLELGKTLKTTVQIEVLPSSTIAVTNISKANYQLDLLEVGSKVFVDKTYIFNGVIPSDCLHQYYLRTAWSDRNTGGSSFLSFKINQPADIIVAVDGAMTNIPDWLNTWIPRTQPMSTNDPRPTRKLYQKYYAAGTVTLGGNHDADMSSSNTMYTVIIAPPDPGQLGQVGVKPSRANATWTMNKPDGTTLNGTGVQNYSNYPTGSYYLTWKALTGYDTPNPTEVSQVLGRGQKITFNANYVRQLGTVRITVQPNAGLWQFRDGDNVLRQGQGNAVITGVPTGSIALAWRPLSGYDLPVATTVTQTLAKNGSIQFIGIYLANNDSVERMHGRIIRYLLGIDSDPTGLDANADGTVNMADAIYTLEHAQLAYPANPVPANYGTSVTLTTTLNWDDVKYAKRYDVFLWKTNQDRPTTTSLRNLIASQVQPAKLDANADYYWQVIPRNDFNQTQGPWWYFHTVPGGANP